MNKKIVGIIVCMLFVGASALPCISGNIEIGRNSGLNQNNTTSSVSTTDWWPMFRHDLSHSGYSTSTGPETNNVLWEYAIGNSMSSPAIVDGKVYIGSESNRMYCLDANTGEKIWSYITNGKVYSSPAVVDGKVYFLSDGGKVYCLNSGTGKKIWDYSIGRYDASSPTVANGKVYFGSGDSNVSCLNADTGAKIWQYKTFQKIITSSPAVVNEKVYIGAESDVYCLNANTGAKIWQYYTNAFIVGSSPAVADGRVYIGGCEDNKIYCINADTGAEIWNFTTSGRVLSSPAIVNNMVYIGSDDNNVYCLNANTGAKIWEYTTGGGMIWSSPAVANGKIYIGSSDNKVYCLNADNGVKIWDFITSGQGYSSPAIANDRLYIGSYNGKVYCFGSSGGNQPPPTITGSAKGTPGIAIEYNFTAIDPQGDEVYYFIDWGDNTNSSWIGPYPSGDQITKSHTWSTKGTYTVKAKAEDIYGNESDWATLTVSMPTVTNVESVPFGFIFVFGGSVDVKIVHVEPGDNYVDLEVLNKPLYIWENGIAIINSGAFVRLNEAKGLFLLSIPICVGICNDYGIIG
jgi:outer membrane protein assembly factor BamB